jgi:hypothetical protein
MKSAVLIVGGERTLSRTIEHLKQNLLEPNRPVLFFAVETDNPGRVLKYFDGFEIGGSLLLPSFRTSEYHHIQSMCMERPAFAEETYIRASKVDGMYWSRDYSMNSGVIISFYQLWKAWCLVLEYERENRMTFDFCVKWRPDMLITKPLVFANIPDSGTEDEMRSMGNSYIKDHMNREVNDGYYEHGYGHPIRDNIVWSFGPDQIFMAKRKNFEKLGNMILYHGLWDSGGPFSFNGESFMQQFCKHQQLLHWVFQEKDWPMYSYSSDCQNMMTILR